VAEVVEIATAAPTAAPSASAESATIDLGSLPSVGEEDAGAPAPSKTAGRTHAAPHPKPAPPPPPPPPSSSGANGSLVAVAVGGNCAFAVNGASKGTSSTLKVSLKPGSYTVTCRSSSGATKSKGVTVRSGETAMAMFKL
jgi:serine/threonine-protein kinase